MKKDKEERHLSGAEKKRLERFENIISKMEQSGYTRHELTIDIGKANVFAIVLLVPLFLIGYGLNYLVNHRIGFLDINWLILFVAFVVLIVIHELIHGACWSLFTSHHFKDIEFGIMKPSMNPYCTCLEPLNKGAYIFGTVMPLVLLGILPMAAGIAVDNSNILILGIIVRHSPILLGLPGAEILSFDEGRIHPCTYEETDSYQVTSMFVNHREQILRRLLEE